MTQRQKCIAIKPNIRQVKEIAIGPFRIESLYISLTDLSIKTTEN